MISFANLSSITSFSSPFFSYHFLHIAYQVKNQYLATLHLCWIPFSLFFQYFFLLTITKRPEDKPLAFLKGSDPLFLVAIYMLHNKQTGLRNPANPLGDCVYTPDINCVTQTWCPGQESNPYQQNRNLPSYPLDYRDIPFKIFHLTIISRLGRFVKGLLYFL